MRSSKRKWRKWRTWQCNGTNGIDSPNGGGGFAANGATGGAAGIGCGGFLGLPGQTAINEVGGNGGNGQGCCCASTPGGGGGGGGFIGGGGAGGGSAGTVGCMLVMTKAVVAAVLEVALYRIFIITSFSKSNSVRKWRGSYNMDNSRLTMPFCTCSCNRYYKSASPTPNPVTATLVQFVKVTSQLNSTGAPGDVQSWYTVPQGCSNRY
ncbi:MAG: hypothetical protein IPI22_11305 [Bacteroidetes bacterium]|nr:hypothetical protein [Bacteroidota bacterium]